MRVYIEDKDGILIENKIQEPFLILTKTGGYIICHNNGDVEVIKYSKNEINRENN